MTVRRRARNRPSELRVRRGFRAVAWVGFALLLLATVDRALLQARAGEIEEGEALFRAHVVPPGAADALLSGLGPTYNVEGCAGCHTNGGRGRPPLRRGEPLTQMIVRLSIEKDGAVMPHPAYGVQLNDQAVPGATPEGRAFVEYSAIKGRFGDGTPFELLKPHYGFLNMAFGRLDERVLFSARVPPPVRGLGVLEAVPEDAILALADPADRNRDGISGRPNRVVDVATGREMLGRFGWKAGQPSLRQQSAEAARIDMGVTSSLFPLEDCPPAQDQCAHMSIDRSPELSDRALQAIEAYLRHLPAPERRAAPNATSARGEQRFAEWGCAACHAPRLPSPSTSTGATAAYTDLLLHDMGEGLADHRPDHEATGREWRTAPLWGLGEEAAEREGVRYLHDGRARDLAEAILWHGGEASIAGERFRVARAADRAALIAFLKTL